MTAVGESRNESQNFISEGSNISKKRKKRKNHDSGEDQVYETPIKSALVSTETVQDAAHENTRRHKKKKHKSHDSDETVDGMTQSTESFDQTPKKHKKHSERVVPEELWNGNEIVESTQGREQTDRGAKRHKHRKHVVGEITEEQICQDEGFTLESAQFSPTVRKKKKRHNSERDPEIETDYLDVIAPHNDSHKKRRRETPSEEEVVAQDGGAVEKNRKRKRLYSEVPFDETHVGHQNAHGENEIEVVAKKKKDAKEVNIATDILKKLTAIDKDVLKVKRHKEKRSKQKTSGAPEATDDKPVSETSGHDKKKHKGQKMDRKKKREKNEESATVEGKPKTSKVGDEKKKEKKKKKKRKKGLPEIMEQDIFPKRDMTADELQQLFDRLLTSLPSSDQLHYTAREVLIDWSLVKFGNFAADYCKKQWLKMAPKIRKLRTLHEIVQDAKNHGISKKSGNLLHKLTLPVSRFLSEICNGLRQEFPDATEDELLAEGTKRYKQLSKDEQNKYAGESRVKAEVLKISGLQLYVDTKVKDYLQTHPKAERSVVIEKFHKRWSSLNDSRKVKYIRRARAQYKAYQSDNQQKSGASTLLRLPKKITKDEQKILDRVNGVPPKPLGSAYMLFCERMSESVHKERPELNSKEMMYEIGRRWSALSKDEQEGYKRELVERTHAYKEFLDQHPEVECETLVPAKSPSTNSHKRTRERKIEFKGEPEKPVDSGYLLFIKELKPSLRDVRPNELFREYGRRWAELSQEEKSEYADKVKDVKRKYEEKLAVFKAELSPEERMEYEKIHPRKKPNRKKSSGKKITKLDASDGSSAVEKSQAPSLLTVNGKEKKKDKGKKKKPKLQGHHYKESSIVGAQHLEAGLSRSFSEMSHVSDAF